VLPAPSFTSRLPPWSTRDCSTCQSEQRLRIGQDPFQCELNAGVKATLAFLPPGLEKRHQRIEVVVRHRAAVGPARHATEDLPRADILRFLTGPRLTTKILRRLVVLPDPFD
jgi:hypothetical protein